MSVKPFNHGVTVTNRSRGDGKTFPKKGQTVHMHYVGTLHGGNNHG